MHLSIKSAAKRVAWGALPVLVMLSGCENPNDIIIRVPLDSDPEHGVNTDTGEFMDTGSVPDSETAADTALLPDTETGDDTEFTGSDETTDSVDVVDSDMPSDPQDPMDTDSGSEPSDSEGSDTFSEPSDTADSESRDTGDSETIVPRNCGDGILTQDEACDDGNRYDDDGCTANCLQVEDGYSCNPPGFACQKIARCGDGTVAFPELCDDGNNDPDDGCSAACKVEIGFKCEGNPSECSHTVCGDSIVEGAEACDDGNAMPYDGCSAACQAEPNCEGDSCVSECGDGLRINEACDDGNTLDGDGCSSLCEEEEGYTCTEENECEEINGECVLRIYAVFRDFNSYGDPQGDFSGGGDLIEGLVEPLLDAAAKPAAVTDVNGVSGGSIASPESFARWYRDTADSETKVGTLVLFDNGEGGYVNRWGAAGEQWCFGSDGLCHDGTPAFFPVDDLTDGSGFVEATIPEEYGGDWLPESEFVTDAVPHNFGFTSEVKYWFFYDETEVARLAFLGDDDLWVFVNGRLALDLGNPHMPLSGTVTVDVNTAAEFDLVHGNVYPIQVFHAERNPTGSSFQLTLSGFDASRSLCLPYCGDGLVGLGEECDDGINDGGYGECYPGCVLGEYCGDGIIQDNEDCDDGNSLDGDDCGSSCRDIIIV